jgi:aerobic carbon-monoxide dehydrogenase small subunit
MPITLAINGELRTLDLPPDTLLIDALRDTCGLKGAAVGCDTCQCGCCTVLVDGDAVKACTMLAVQADGARIVTIEGLAEGDRLHPLQQAFHERHALQCGYCTPGFIMSAVELIEKYNALDEAKVRHLIEGNICRCTGYENIVDAILDVARARGATA